jgi:hypothetical protein
LFQNYMLALLCCDIVFSSCSLEIYFFFLPFGVVFLLSHVVVMVNQPNYHHLQIVIIFYGIQDLNLF